MANIKDLVTANSVGAYWDNFPSDQALLGEMLFPNERIIGDDATWLKGSNNGAIGLSIASYDTNVLELSRGEFEKITSSIPFFKNSMTVNEKLRSELNRVLKYGDEKMRDVLLNRIFNDTLTLRRNADVRIERMRWEAITTGRLNISENGVNFVLDYKMPAENKVTPTTSWGSTGANPIADLNAWKLKMSAVGKTVSRAFMNSITYNKMVQSVAAKYVVASTMLPTATVEQYIKTETGLTFYVYDGAYKAVDGTIVKYIEDNIVVLAPAVALGSTMFGTTPEESDLMSDNAANVYVTDPGITVTAYGTVDPVAHIIKASMVTAPSFPEVDNVIVATVVNG